jgi:guanylate kinase
MNHPGTSRLCPLRRKGHLFIISAPSGAGKTTLCKALLKRLPTLVYSVSYTTRKPRLGEQEGVDYHFIDKNKFENGINNHAWAEWAKVHGNYYGTAACVLDQSVTDGKNILLDIDVQGAKQILAHYPDAVTIFIVPPSMEILKARLEARRKDSQASIHQRLENAKMEMVQKGMYRHIIVNDKLSCAMSELHSIILKYLQANDQKWAHSGN